MFADLRQYVWQKSLGCQKYFGSTALYALPLIASAAEEGMATTGISQLDMTMLSTAAVLCLGIGAAAILFPWE